MTLNLGKAHPWVGAALRPGTAEEVTWLRQLRHPGESRVPQLGASADSENLPLLHRARHHPRHELSLEREEHGQRDHHRDEGARCQDLDVAAELPYLLL